MAEINKKQELVIRRNFEASRTAVWKAWTVAEHFSRWYGLEGSSLTDVRMDVRSGGSWRAVMHVAGGKDISWLADYVKVEEPEMLAFAMRNPENHEGPEREMVTVEFEETSGHTTMLFKQSGNL